MPRTVLPVSALAAFVLVVSSTLSIGCESEPSSPPVDDVFIDSTPPTVLSIDPTDGATNVSPRAPVVVTFSEGMDAASLTDGAASIRSADGVVAALATLQGGSLTLTPEADLAAATEYTVSVGTELTDLAGNALAEPFETVFTTDLRTQPVGEDLLFVGRHDAADPSAVRLSWSGSGFVTRFRGTGARATLSGGSDLTVVIDGEVQPDPLTVTTVASAYDLASGLPIAEHTVEVYRRQEGRRPPTVVAGVEVNGEPLLALRRTRQIEIVGDSWSTGDGVDPQNGNCDIKAQNHSMTWGALTAAALDAELSNVSLGGIGLVGDPMAPLYPRVIATETGSTGTIQPVDVVLVALGGNDEDQPSEVFTPAYVALLEQIRAQHTDALIACVFPRLEDNAVTVRLRAAINAAITERTNSGDGRVIEIDIELEELADLACDGGHPGPETHERMSDNAISVLKAELGW